MLHCWPVSARVPVSVKPRPSTSLVRPFPERLRALARPQVAAVVVLLPRAAPCQWPTRWPQSSPDDAPEVVLVPQPNHRPERRPQGRRLENPVRRHRNRVGRPSCRPRSSVLLVLGRHRHVRHRAQRLHRRGQTARHPSQLAAARHRHAHRPAHAHLHPNQLLRQLHQPKKLHQPKLHQPKQHRLPNQPD